MDVVFLHFSPCGLITGKALLPQLEARELPVRQFFLGAENTRQEFQLVAGETEGLPPLRGYPRFCRAMAVENHL